MILEISPSTLIAEGTRFQGTITFLSGGQVFGTVEGDLIQQTLEPLQIGKNGWVHGTISAKGPVLIEGKVEGTIKSATQISLLPSAVVNGTLEAPRIVVRAGAFFDGEFRMKSHSKKTEPTSRAA